MNNRNMACFARLGTMGQICEPHGFHVTPLEVDNGGLPIVAHPEDEMATRPGAPEHV